MQKLKIVALNFKYNLRGAKINIVYKCDICGKEINTNTLYYTGNTCSNECRIKFNTKNSTQRRKERRDAARKLRPDTLCAYCKKPFRPLRSDAKYCSNKCKQAEYREKNSWTWESMRKLCFR